MPTSRTEVRDLAERLTTSLLDAIDRIETLAPDFPGELYEARDRDNDMQVADFLERLAKHSRQHRHELAAVRASIGAARPTDPGDTHPVSGEPYAATWYRWFLLEAFLQRAELVGELIDLTDADLDRKPSPGHTAGNDRTAREVCEHVLHVQDWLLKGIEEGIHSYREDNQ